MLSIHNLFFAIASAHLPETGVLTRAVSEALGKPSREEAMLSMCSGVFHSLEILGRKRTNKLFHLLLSCWRIPGYKYMKTILVVMTAGSRVGVAPGIWCVEARGATEDPTTHRMPPTPENDSAPQVSSPTFEKLF